MRGVRTLTGARVAIVVAGALIAGTALSGLPAGAGRSARPTTGFEDRKGASWTTHKEELNFLAAVDSASRRVQISVIGQSIEKRPLHLVRLGHPAPRSLSQARREPVILFVCTQHGNEPAGREACLQLLRDLAFTTNPALVEQLRAMTLLFVPTANPDGRAENTRGNSNGVDINRDHLNLETPEARAIARVVRDYKPEVVMDHHEYGPSIPAAYDDEVLYLWPRNLNVHSKVRRLAKSLATDYIKKDAEEAGYTADEYGMYAVGNQDIHQAAGDGDEGIARNAMGLRHSLGVLIETAVTADPRNGPGEVMSESEVNVRRVRSHVVTARSALRFMRSKGFSVATATARAARAKTREGRRRSAPVYFGGADNDPPEEDEIQDPPPCRYRLTDKQAGTVSSTLKLLGIRASRRGPGVRVSMAQPAEPLIPLLLDRRGLRHSVAAKPVIRCR